MKNEKTNLPFLNNITNFALVTGGIAHDLSNVLAVIVGYSELSFEIFSKKIIDDDDKEFINNAEAYFKEGSNKASNLIKYLKLLSRKFYQESDDDLLSVDIQKVLKKIKINKYWDQNIFKLRIVGANKIPCLHFQEPIITLILDEIIRNSHKIALIFNISITLTISLKYFPQESLLKIVGKDNGPGFDKQMLNNLSYKSDYTGLYILSQISYRLGGWMMIDNDKKGGAIIELAIKV
ncbi:MAG: hypothetical protein ACD_45C00175G0002 [uncultured bacterium]|nr:MAG: hypothetical protein ACD_45C00175G0002 [uncultured bacterium]